MDEFVKNILQNWKLNQFIDRFEKAGIDEEIFRQIESDMLDKIFDNSECGFKKNFLNRLEMWHNSSIEDREKKTPDKCSISFSTEILQVNRTVDFVESTTSVINDLTINKSTSSMDESSVSIISIPVYNKSVRELLQTTTRGKIVEQAFKLNMTIDTRLLSDLIIEYEFESTHSYRISTNRFLELADQLGQIFKKSNQTSKDCAELFYYPFQKATKSCKTVNAGGVLYEKYLKCRHQLISLQIISKEETQQEVIVLSTNEESIKWLQENDEPQEDVINKWKETFAKRHLCENVNYYFSQYKCLRSPMGHILISLDFDTVYPDSAKNFTDSWDDVSKLIVSHAKSKKKLFLSDNILITSEKYSALGLLCLPRILGVILRKRKGIEPFGCHSEDVKNSFIVHVQTQEHLNNFKEQRTADANVHGKLVGPYVAVVGNLEEDGNPEIIVYVVINNYTFHVETNKIADAVDYCFKSFFALNIEFTPECIFLQRYIYKVKLKSAQQYIVVTKLIDELSKLK